MEQNQFIKQVYQRISNQTYKRVTTHQEEHIPKTAVSQDPVHAHVAHVLHFFFFTRLIHRRESHFLIYPTALSSRAFYCTK